MTRIMRLVACLFALLLPVAARADLPPLPKPRLQSILLETYKDAGHYQPVDVAVPTPVISDAAVRNLDPVGRVVVIIKGDGLAPDNEGHPGGFRGGYVHLYMRGIDPAGSAGGWKRCDDGDCLVLGSTAPDTIAVALSPGFYLDRVGSRLEFRVWISWTPAEVDDPAATQIRHSPWSDVFAITRTHLAGNEPRATAPPADPEAPSIDKVSPNPLEFGAGHPTDWTITVTGSTLCSPRLKIILNDDAANPVPGTCTPAGTEQQLRFALPPMLRKAGIWRLILRNSAGDSGPGLIVVKELAFVKAGNQPAPVLAPRLAPTAPITAPTNRPVIHVPPLQQTPNLPTPIPQEH